MAPCDTGGGVPCVVVANEEKCRPISTVAVYNPETDEYEYSLVMDAKEAAAAATAAAAAAEEEGGGGYSLVMDAGCQGEEEGGGEGGRYLVPTELLTGCGVLDEARLARYEDTVTLLTQVRNVLGFRQAQSNEQHSMGCVKTGNGVMCHPGLRLQ